MVYCTIVMLTAGLPKYIYSLRVEEIKYKIKLLHSALEPYSLLAYLDPPVFLNADPDPAKQNCSVTF